MITFHCIVNFSRRDYDSLEESAIMEKLSYEVAKQFRSHLSELSDVTKITKIESDNDSFDVRFTINLISDDEYRYLRETEKTFNVISSKISDKQFNDKKDDKGEGNV